jgi:hypothetical protein
MLTCTTPIPTAGTCQDLAGFTSLHGTSMSYSYTANPRLNNHVEGGALPVGGWVGSANSRGQYLLQSASDWAAYVSNSLNPSGSYPIPFDPSTQMLLVISSTHLNCCSGQDIQRVCVSSSQIVVYVVWDGVRTGCVDNAGAGDMAYTESLGVILPKSAVPVLWNNPCGIPPQGCMIAN